MPSPYTASHPGESTGSLASEQAAESWAERYDAAYNALEDAVMDVQDVTDGLYLAGRWPSTARKGEELRDATKAVQRALDALLTVVNE
jgi:hypothetical protein